jgi:ribosomal protein S21
MSEANRDFEWARKRLKRAIDKPNAYTENKKEYLLSVARQKNGKGAEKELRKEFNL